MTNNSPVVNKQTPVNSGITLAFVSLGLSILTVMNMALFFTPIGGYAIMLLWVITPVAVVVAIISLALNHQKLISLISLIIALIPGILFLGAIVLYFLNCSGSC